jgi:enamine deaminase RidA (YjgF/YER057c/UK114 family)
MTEAGAGRMFIVAPSSGRADPSRAASEVYARIAGAVRDAGMEIVHERIFGSLGVEQAVMAARAAALGKGGIVADGPVTYIEGRPPWGEGLAGVIVQAVSCTGSDGKVWTIMDGRVPCGRGWRRNDATYLVLQNIHGLEDGPRHADTPPLQARRMIDRAERILREQGATYRDVVRTWFYLADIVEWYDTFNLARNARYGEFGLMPASDSGRFLLPASTGIGGRSSRGAAGVLNLLAVTGPEESRPVIKRLSSGGQKDAFRYGSAFSRGALICDSDVSLIELSGTAAIDETGKSLYPEDIHAQVECTLDKIETLLDQEGATLEDIRAATVFVKHPQYASVFREIAAARGLENFPGICVVADICRDELLFEMDAEVAFSRGGR